MSSTEAATTGQRVRFQDVKPYDAPARRDDLHGPRGGPVSLPHWVYWGPNPIVNLDSESDVIKAYQATIQEGRRVDQERLLNRDLLIAIWPELMMPPRVRQLWEGRFPELVVSA
jgi:hypothetical protein